MTQSESGGPGERDVADGLAPKMVVVDIQPPSRSDRTELPGAAEVTDQDSESRRALRLTLKKTSASVPRTRKERESLRVRDRDRDS